MKINSAKDLEVYKKAYRLAMDIFEISKLSARGEIRSNRPGAPIFALGVSELA
jgi:hypothetical protein